MRSSIAALLSVFAASLCCLPLGTLLLATGSGTAAFLVPPSAQPWLMALAVGFLGFGAWRAFVRPRCVADRGWPQRATLVVASLAIAVMWLAPQRVAALFAGRAPVATAATVSPPALPISSVDAVRAAFNEAVDETRLLVLLSPT